VRPQEGEYLHNLRDLRAAFGDAFKRKSRPVKNISVASEKRSGRPALRIVSLGKAPKKAPEVHDRKKGNLHIADFTA